MAFVRPTGSTRPVATAYSSTLKYAAPPMPMANDRQISSASSIADGEGRVLWRSATGSIKARYRATPRADLSFEGSDGPLIPRRSRRFEGSKAAHRVHLPSQPGWHDCHLERPDHQRER